VENQGSIPNGGRNVLFTTKSIMVLGSIQPSVQVPGATSPGVEQSEHETDHSLQCSTKIKKV